jgi:hypothetical protein
MSAFNKLIRILLHFSEQLHTTAEQMEKKTHDIEHSQQKDHPMAKSKIDQLKHNSHLLKKASLALRHAASEVSQVK